MPVTLKGQRVNRLVVITKNLIDCKGEAPHMYEIYAMAMANTYVGNALQYQVAIVTEVYFASSHLGVYNKHSAAQHY